MEYIIAIVIAVEVGLWVCKTLLKSKLIRIGSIMGGGYLYNNPHAINDIMNQVMHLIHYQ